MSTNPIIRFLLAVTFPISFPLLLVALGVAGGDRHYSIREALVEAAKTLRFLIVAPFAILGFLALVGLNTVFHGTNGLN